MSLLLIGSSLVLLRFILSLGRFLNCLMVLENFNVLLLFGSLCILAGDTRVLFLALMVIFTLEVTLGLVVLTRLWDYSCLVDVTSF